MNTLDNEQFPVSSDDGSVSKEPVESTATPSELVSSGVEGSPQGIAPKADLAPTKKTGRPKGKLGRRTQAFMELILAGHPTLKAYELAGYKGQKNAAYVLRCQLKERLEERLLGDGISREGLKLELKKLLELPLDPNRTAVSVKERLQILKFMDKVTEQQEKEHPSVTPFLVNIQDPKSVTIQEAK